MAWWLGVESVQQCTSSMFSTVGGSGCARAMRAARRTGGGGRVSIGRGREEHACRVATGATGTGRRLCRRARALPPGHGRRRRTDTDHSIHIRFVTYANNAPGRDLYLRNYTKSIWDLTLSAAVDNIKTIIESTAGNWIKLPCKIKRTVLPR